MRTLFEYGIHQKATISIQSGFVRVAIPAKGSWKPGQHCFLRFPGFGVWQAISSHPFTICSTPSTRPDEPNELVFYIRPHGGFTAKLHAHAFEYPGSSISVLVDGPYGGVNMQRFNNADHILVAAGGSGAGWCLPLVEHFVRRGAHKRQPHADINENADVEKETSAGVAGTRTSLRLVLATRDTASRAWFLGAVNDVLARCRTMDHPDDVRIEVHLTGEAARDANLSHKASEDLPTPSGSSTAADKIEVPKMEDHATVPGREYEGRPQLPSIIHEEAHIVREGHQSLGVFVCGPITMQNDVRNAVAAENLEIVRGSTAQGIYLHSEHFSWA